MSEKCILNGSTSDLLPPLIGQTFPTVPDNHAVLEAKRKELVSLEAGLQVLGKALDAMTNHRKGNMSSRYHLQIKNYLLLY